MSAALNLTTELKSLAEPQEIELFGVLCADNKVLTALLCHNTTMLSRVFNVSVSSYEDHLKDSYEVFFRNYSGKFEIRQARNGLLEVRDDVLGTIGTSIVARLLNRDQSNRSSTYLGGKRVKASLLDMATCIDMNGLKQAVVQLPSIVPKASKVCAKIDRALDEVMLSEPLPSDSPTRPVIDKWDSFLADVVSLFTLLRSNPVSIMVKDNRPAQQTVTLTEYFKSMGQMSLSEISFKPAEGNKFSSAERAALSLAADSFDLVSNDIYGELMVAASRDVFTYIGDKFETPVELPEWTEDWSPTAVESDSTTCPTVSPPVRVIASPVKGGGHPEQIMRDYLNVNMNKYQDVVRKLQKGGFSDEAQALLGALSKAKRLTLLKVIEDEVPFRDAVDNIAAALSLESDEALAEVVASQLVCRKSAFRVDLKNMTVRRI